MDTRRHRDALVWNYRAGFVMIMLGVHLVKKTDGMQEQMWNFSREMGIFLKIGAGESGKSEISRQRRTFA